ncbi:MAG: hypothetical protein ABJ081_01285 [Hyphomicrobiales bacterium]
MSFPLTIAICTVVVVIVWFWMAVRKKAQRQMYISEMYANSSPEDCYNEFKRYREIAIDQLSSTKMNTQNGKDFDEPIERCVILADRMAMLKGHEHGPEHRVKLRFHLLNKFKSEADSNLRSVEETILERKKPPPKSKKSQKFTKELEQVTELTKRIGCTLTPYGAGVALLSLQSDYSPAETTSLIAVVTIAHAAQNNDVEDLVELATKGYSVLEHLKEWKDKGLMRKDIWKNDSTAIGKIIFVNSDTQEWIDRVLSDPINTEDDLAIM